MIKYYKFGFGRTTDYVNEEIRLGRMSREKGVDLVERFDDKCSSEYIASYCDYLEIGIETFWARVRQCCDTRLFEINDDGSIKRRFTVGVGLP